MSLRRRLFTLLLVSCLALAASVVGLLRMVSLSADAREANAEALGTRAMLAVAHHLDLGVDPTSAAMTTVLDDLARTLDDGSVGVCAVDGSIGATKAVSDASEMGPAGDGDLRPLDRDGVIEACRSAAATLATKRIVAPTHVLSIVTLRSWRGAGPVAFALVRVPRESSGGASSSLPLLALAGFTSALLLALTAHGAWVLRASTASLESSLEAMTHDLRAPIAEPRAIELANVATHLRTLASTLADAQERERDLNRAVEEQARLAGLGRVVAGVAHEVRNPLAGMKLRLDAMSARPLDARSRVDVERCLGEVARLDRLVRTLLLASRKREIERARFDGAAWIDERLALAMPLVEGTEIHLERDGEGSIVGEREELSGVLDNLLRNAIEASPRDGVVCVRLAATDEDARVDVVDGGAGVPDDRLSELFEPFFTTKGEGTGLGLLLARATVEAHGGTLDYARTNERTHFTVTIPRTPNNATRRMAP